MFRAPRVHPLSCLVPGAVLALLLAAVPVDAEPRTAARRVIAPPGTGLGLPFSPGILSGDFLFLSGAIGNLPGTTDVPGDAAAQARRTFDNLGAVLEAAGMDFSHAVDLTVFVSDSRLFRQVAEVYTADYAPDLLPAATAVEADVAIPGALTEIAMIAARPGVERRAVAPQGWPASAERYSWGVLAGDTLFIAGMVGLDPVSGELASGLAAQTRRAMENVGAVLAAAEMGYENLVYCGIYLVDGRHFAAMNEVYQSFFETAAPPARATVRARLVSPALEIEIQCRAVRGERQPVLPPGTAPSPRLSPAIRAGDRLFLSGMVGRKDGAFAAGIEAQTRVVLERLEATLAAAGMGFGDVEEAAVYLTDIRHYAAMNEVYRQAVGTPPPARATVGSQLMAPDALVEIRMTASRPPETTPEGDPPAAAGPPPGDG